MAITKKKRPKRKASNKKKQTGDFVTGSKLSRKSDLLKWLRIIFIIVLVIFVFAIVLKMGYLNQVKKVVITPPDDYLQSDLNDEIAEACKAIGITDENFQLYNQEDQIYIKIGINRQEMDLLLVNSIITGKVEAAGGKLINAKEAPSGNYQILEFQGSEKSKPYVVRIHYGDYEKQGKEIFLIIDDLGSYKHKLLDDFCALDEEVTFSIIPNEPYYRESMLKADSTGHDIMMHLPMEPVDIKRNNPGARAILVDQSPARIKENTRWALERVPLAVGVNNHMGSLATSMQEVMKPVLEVMRENGMFFIDSFTTANSIVSQIASQEMVMSSRRDIFLDNGKLRPEDMEAKLQKLERIAKLKDQIVVISHCHNKEKLQFTKEFIEKAKAAGYRFERISKLFSSAAGV